MEQADINSLTCVVCGTPRPAEQRLAAQDQPFECSRCSTASRKRSSRSSTPGAPGAMPSSRRPAVTEDQILAWLEEPASGQEA